MTEEAVTTVEATEDRPLDKCMFQGEDGTCEKLNNTVCKAGGCSFMVMPEEYARKQVRWAQRLSGLDDAKQKEISKKYYGGGRPWRVNK